MSDLFNDFFNPIARDGAGLIEVQMRIQSALEALADSDPALYSSCAREHAGRALARGLEALTLAEDKRCLEERSVWAKSSYNSQV